MTSPLLLILVPVIGPLEPGVEAPLHKLYYEQKETQGIPVWMPGDFSDEAVTPSLEPGTTFYLDFPDLGTTWRDVPTRAGVYLPSDYTTDRQLPLFAWFSGGAGTDNPKKPIAITAGAGFVCVALPYRTEEGCKPGGWQTPWSYYETILERVEKVVPNIDPARRVCGGFSSGGAAIMFQIGNSEEAFQEYFYAFMPGGAGWPMGGLETIPGRPMLALMGENDKRLPKCPSVSRRSSTLRC